jgi:poly(3-hydroxybutyrate) depolymerase
MSYRRVTDLSAGLLAYALTLLAVAGCSTAPKNNQSSMLGPGGLAPGSVASGGATAPAMGSGGTGSGGSSLSGTGGQITPAGTSGMGTGTGGMAAASGTGGAGSTAGNGAATGGSGAPSSDAGTIPTTCSKDLTAKPGQDDCTAPLKPGDDRLCKMMIGGMQRQFYIYAPMSFDPCKPASLIMDCHGLTETAEVHTGQDGFNLNGMMFPKGYGSGWRRAIQGDNAIVVTPQGISDSWTAATDVPFVNMAADAVEAIADVDKERVYVTGISMGGMMTVATGCGDSKRWRGMMPVAMLTQSCDQLARPAPFIAFHATGDQLTDYAADMSGAANVAQLNHCKMGPTADPMMVYGGANTVSDATCFEHPVNVGAPDNPNRYTYPIVACQSSLPESSCVKWTQCDEGVEVVFCTVAAGSQPIGGHILYHNDTALQLATVGWKFFKKFWK